MSKSNRASFVKMAKVNTAEVQKTVLGARDRFQEVKVASIIASDDELIAIEVNMSNAREASKEFKDDIEMSAIFKEEIGGAKAVKTAIINATLADEETNAAVEQHARDLVNNTFGGFTSNYLK